MTTAKQAARILQNLEERVTRLERRNRVDDKPTRVQSTRDEASADDSVGTPTTGAPDTDWTSSDWGLMEWGGTL